MLFLFISKVFTSEERSPAQKLFLCDCRRRSSAGFRRFPTTSDSFRSKLGFHGSRRLCSKRRSCWKTRKLLSNSWNPENTHDIVLWFWGVCSKLFWLFHFGSNFGFTVWKLRMALNLREISSLSRTEIKLNWPDKKSDECLENNVSRKSTQKSSGSCSFCLTGSCKKWREKTSTSNYNSTSSPTSNSYNWKKHFFHKTSHKKVLACKVDI